jgi:anti-sigma28 factor (negative regulator of flagellin synthesis)
MHISGLDPSGDLGRLIFQVQAREVASADAHQTHQVKPNRPNDSVALSPLAREVGDLSNKVSQQPEIREDRVRRIHETIQQNQPLATSQQVADSIVTDTILNSLSFS